MTFTPVQDFAICTLASGSAALQNVEVDNSGQYVAPRRTFKQYSKQIQLGDGTVRGAGWTVAEWTWDVISPTQRAWLRTFIPGQSAELFIRTKTFDNLDTGVVYSCVGIWPIESEELDIRRPIRFTIKFQRMVPA